jgi:membrane-bound metal-dependent hydrolase YbcI (DUF457 family)
MFAIGHFALGYLTGKGASKLFNVKINLPLLLAVSVIVDVDLLFFGFMSHRGLTHSLMVIVLLTIPFAIKYKKAILPYLAAIFSHIFIGDLFGGVEYFWPVSKAKYGLLNFQVNSPTMALVELTLFFITIALMYKQNDLQTLFKPANRKWSLIIASGSLIGPLLWLGKTPDPIPVLLIIPSLAWLCIFAYSLLIELRFKLSSGW